MSGILNLQEAKSNHFHPRNDKKGYCSPMKGIPNKDLTLLYNLINSGQLLQDTLRFK
jgi:hypothetical protein